MAGGRGHLRKRGKVYYVVLEIEPHPDGRRRQRWISTGMARKADAEVERTRLLRARDTGTDLEPSSTTVATMLERWLADIVARTTEPGTLIAYRGHCQRYIVPALGATRLQKLQPAQIDALYTALLARGLSRGTVSDTHTVIHSALEQAVRWQLLLANPADRASPPTVTYASPRIWDAETLADFLAVVESHRYGAVFLLALGTGMRIGECLGLHWRDVELDGSRLFVRQQLAYTPGLGHYLKVPKGKRGRQITLDADTIAVLRAHRDRQRLAQRAAAPVFVDRGLVFCRPDGSFLPINTVRRAWLEALQKWGIAHMKFHGLRHLHATLLMLQGVPSKVVAERLGHSSTAMTEEVYSHVTPSMQAAAAQGIAAALAEVRRRGAEAEEGRDEGAREAR